MDKKSKIKYEVFKNFSKAFLEFLRNLTPSILFFTISVAICKFNYLHISDCWLDELFALFAFLVFIVSLFMNTVIFIDYSFQASKLIKCKEVIRKLKNRKHHEKLRINYEKEYNFLKCRVLLSLIIFLGPLIGLPIIYILFLK